MYKSRTHAVGYLILLGMFVRYYLVAQMLHWSQPPKFQQQGPSHPTESILAATLQLLVIRDSLQQL